MVEEGGIMFESSEFEGVGFVTLGAGAAPNKPEPPIDGRALPLVVREGVRGAPSSSDIIP